MVNNQHYLYRMTVLVAMTSLASVVSHETLYQTILPAVISCAQDKVSPVVMQPAQAMVTHSCAHALVCHQQKTVECMLAGPCFVTCSNQMRESLVQRNCSTWHLMTKLLHMAFGDICSLRPALSAEM